MRFKRSQTSPLVINGEIGNSVVLEESVSASGNVHFKGGVGNRLKIGEDSIFTATVLVHGSGNSVLIGRDCKIRGNILSKDKTKKFSLAITPLLAMCIFCARSDKTF